MATWKNLIKKIIGNYLKFNKMKNKNNFKKQKKSKIKKIKTELLLNNPKIKIYEQREYFFQPTNWNSDHRYKMGYYSYLPKKLATTNKTSKRHRNLLIRSRRRRRTIRRLYGKRS